MVKTFYIFERGIDCLSAVTARRLGHNSKKAAFRNTLMCFLLVSNAYVALYAPM